MGVYIHYQEVMVRNHAMVVITWKQCTFHFESPCLCHLCCFVGDMVCRVVVVWFFSFGVARGRRMPCRFGAARLGVPHGGVQLVVVGICYVGLPFICCWCCKVVAHVLWLIHCAALLSFNRCSPEFVFAWC